MATALIGARELTRLTQAVYLHRRAAIVTQRCVQNRPYQRLATADVHWVYVNTRAVVVIPNKDGETLKL